MNVTVNAKLYDFLKEHETSLYTKDFERNKTVFAVVFVDFHDLSDYAEIVGEYPFEEGGLEVIMKKYYICIPLNETIESNGQCLSDYQSCFSECDWENYKDRIAEMEKD